MWTFKAYSSIGKNTFSILIREDKHLTVYYAFNEMWMLRTKEKKEGNWTQREIKVCICTRNNTQNVGTLNNQICH